MSEVLEAAAREMRREIMTMIHKAGSGHPGASLSSVDIITTLFFDIMRHDPSRPGWDERDRFFLSKGHAAPALYTALALRGYFPREELATLRRLGSRLQGHPSRRCPGVEVGTGSLGHGFSIAAGTAWGLRLQGSTGRVFALLGDGECSEGIVWETALFARHHSLGNLTAIVDCNGYTNDGLLREIMDMEPFADKWRAFGWDTVEIDGHDFLQLRAALAGGGGPGTPRVTPGAPPVTPVTRPGTEAASPRCILARTRKGKGVRYLEQDASFASRSPTADQLAAALRDLA